MSSNILRHASSEIQCSEQLVVGFIMDGNRRWAKKNNASLFDAYLKGFDIFCLTIKICITKKISQVIFYTLSHDNFMQRQDAEIKTLFDTGLHLLQKKKQYFIDNKIKITFIGNYQSLQENIKEMIYELEKDTDIAFPTITVHLLFLYNPYEDVFCAEEKNKLKYSYNIPNIDIIIRTGGNNRLSGFLPIQSMYSNIISIPEFWPDLDHEIIYTLISKKFINNYGK
jgi:undecaprenyl diphosphate synthase